MSEEPRRCGFAALLGAPNAGKSSLVNAIVGAKVAIVTHKVQTTRSLLRGVAIRGAAQIILVDTPGVFAAKRKLDRAMVRAAFGSIEDADAIVHVIDAPAQARFLEGRPTGADARGAEDAKAVEARLQEAGAKTILALNKVDAMARPALLAVAQALFRPERHEAVFMLSAKTGSGVNDLAARLAAQMPEGPWLYPEDQTADLPVRVLAAEITREKLMLRLHDELPYDLTVETESWQERKDGSARIDQVVYVARESQRQIAIGDKAAVIKAVGKAARQDLESLLDRRIHLFLTVKLREGWAEERERFDALGLDFDL
ncbi:MAG: GTPase Era [Alphaproteobacteria bacterium]|nr:GTPase Era [Alphaproteobacteria bacterium]